MADFGSLLGAAGLGGAIGQAIVRLELDSAKYTSELKAAQAQTTTGANTMGSTFGKFGATAKLGLAVGGAALVKFGVDSVKAFQEAEQVMAQTEAVLRSTGGAANVTAQDVTSLAARWQELTGIEDDVIQASSNMLLTFTDVRNEVGKGNDVFNQAQVAILDMATAMNQGALPSAEGLKSATIQLGKALNDPIRGLTALSKVGVNFTDATRDQIAALVTSGDTMAAQKIILAELSKEFGGAAKAAGDTFAGSMAKAAAKVDDLQEELGAVLAPAIADVATQMAELLETMGPILEVVFSAATEAIATAAENLSDMAEPLTAILELLPELNAKGNESAGMFERLSNVVQLGDPTRILHKWDDFKNVLTDFGIVAGDDTGAMEEQVSVLGALTEAAQSAAASFFDDMLPALDKAVTTHKEATQAAREQRLALLALSDSFLGIVDSANQTSEAQRILNQLERAGRDETKAYEQAVLDALEAQIGLENAVLSYGKELAESGETARSVREKIRELGSQFGIQKNIIGDLIKQVVLYIQSLNNIPSSVTTSVHISGGGTTGGISQFATGAIVAAQDGLMARRATLALIGEGNYSSPFGRGAEAVLPLNDRTMDRLGAAVARHMQGGSPGTLVNHVTVEIDGQQVATVLKRALLVDATRNGGATGL